MDANLTRFHLLLGKADWTRCTGPDGAAAFGIPEAVVAWDEEQYEVSLQPKLFQFIPAARHLKPNLGSPRGTDSDARRRPGTDLETGTSFLAISSRLWSIPPAATRRHISGRRATTNRAAVRPKERSSQ